MVTHSSYSAIVSTRRMTTESLESDGRGVDGEAGIIELESIIDAVIPPTESSRRRSGSMLSSRRRSHPAEGRDPCCIPPTESSRRRSGSMLSSHRRSHPAEGRDPLTSLSAQSHHPSTIRHQRSSHPGLSFSMTSNFRLRGHLFIVFSRVIALIISRCCSYQTNCLTPYCLVKPSAQPSRCCQIRLTS